MVFAPIICATVVLGIARMKNMKELGRVGARALIYIEVVLTIALALVMLLSLVFRGVAFEFRFKQPWIMRVWSWGQVLLSSRCWRRSSPY